MKKIFFTLFMMIFCTNLFGFEFTDDLDRKISVEKPKNVAVLQGSLASVWLLSGGKITAATSDCFSEPPEMTNEKAKSENEKWNTNGFFEHKAGFFEYLGESQTKIQNVGTMMNPNVELIISSGVDFVILSANLQAHKKIEKTLQNVGIKCAYFYYEDFSSFLKILDIFCKINKTPSNFVKFGENQQKQIESILKYQNHSKILLLRASASNVVAKSSDSLSVGKLLKEFGLKNIADSDNTYTENLSMEKIIIDDPDFIFVTTMGTNDKKTNETIEKELKSNPAWKNLKAVKNEKYFVLPKELFHFKPGKRWAESYEVMKKILD